MPVIDTRKAVERACGDYRVEYQDTILDVLGLLSMWRCLVGSWQYKPGIQKRGHGWRCKYGSHEYTDSI